MPEKKTIEKARNAKREGKSPSTQAGPFVEEEIEHVREGKHGARSTKQAIAIGLSKARRAGVDLPPQEGGASAKKEEKDRKAAHEKTPKSTKRSAAAKKALKREPRAAASKSALSRHAKEASKKRGHAKRSDAAKKAARTKGPAERSAAAKEAARARAAKKR